MTIDGSAPFGGNRLTVRGCVNIAKTLVITLAPFYITAFLISYFGIKDELSNKEILTVLSEAAHA